MDDEMEKRAQEYRESLRRIEDRYETSNDASRLTMRNLLVTLTTQSFLYEHNSASQRHSESRSR